MSNCDDNKQITVKISGCGGWLPTTKVCLSFAIIAWQKKFGRLTLDNLYFHIKLGSAICFAEIDECCKIVTRHRTQSGTNILCAHTFSLVWLPFTDQDQWKRIPLWYCHVCLWFQESVAQLTPVLFENLGMVWKFTWFCMCNPWKPLPGRNFVALKHLKTHKLYIFENKVCPPKLYKIPCSPDHITKTWNPETLTGKELAHTILEKYQRFFSLLEHS